MNEHSVNFKRTHRIKTLPTKQNRPSLMLSIKNKMDGKMFKVSLNKIDELIQSKRHNVNRKSLMAKPQEVYKMRLSMGKFEKPLNVKDELKQFYLMDCCNNERLICKLLKQRGRWAQSSNKNGNNHLIWGHINYSLSLRLKGTEVLSRIPGSSQLTNKGRLYQNIESYCQKKRLSINFLPITFHLNKEGPLHLLRQNVEQFIDFYLYVKENTTLSNTWILKPTNMNQGREIHLFNSFQQLFKILGVQFSSDRAQIGQYIQEYITKNRSLIVQKYIENPLLLKGHKFDIRIWVLVDHRGQYYIFQEGYLRFTSAPYKLNEESIKDNYIHLTNHSLQKYSPNYSNHHNLQQMAALKQYLQTKSERSFDQIMEEIKEIVKIAIKATLGTHKTEVKNKSFEIFGFDFLIDREMNVRLIEANCNPAITQDCDFLGELLHKMINDSFKLTIDKIFNIKSMHSYNISRLSSDNSWQFLGQI